VTRTNGGGFVPASVQQQTSDWAHQRIAQGQPTSHQSRNVHHRQPFGLSVASAGDRSYTSANLSDRSGSANEVENMLLQQPARIATSNGWQVPYNHPSTSRSGQRILLQFLLSYICLRSSSFCTRAQHICSARFKGIPSRDYEMISR